MNNPASLQGLSLYPLAIQEQRAGMMTSSMATLLAISHGIEDAVIQHRLRETFYAGFQRFSAFLPQLNRFAQLAALCGEVLVFGVPDAPAPVIPNVRFIELSPDSALAREWFITFTHPDLTVALLTREIGTGDSVTTFGRGRLYQGVLTFKPELVTAAQMALVHALDHAAAAPAPLALTPPLPYFTFLQIFTQSLEGRNRQLTGLYQTLDQRTQALERLNQIVKTMMSRVAWEDAALQSEQPTLSEEAALKQETLTILCSDIQGFTTLNETRPAQPLVHDLNRYLDMLATVVYQNHGDVDKFLGDGMLAFFKQPAAALHAALEIQRRIEDFNAQQLAHLRDPFPTRVGLVTGPCLIARVGSRDRQEVTILGDTVNTASRLQALTQTGWILMDEATQIACGQPPTLPTQVKVRGKAGMQPVYQVLPEDFDKVREHLTAMA